MSDAPKPTSLAELSPEQAQAARARWVSAGHSAAEFDAEASVLAPAAPAANPNPTSLADLSSEQRARARATWIEAGHPGQSWARPRRRVGQAEDEGRLTGAAGRDGREGHIFLTCSVRTHPFPQEKKGNGNHARASLYPPDFRVCGQRLRSANL